MRNLRYLTLVLAASALLTCGGGTTVSDPVASPSEPVQSGPFDLLFTGLAVPHARQLFFVAVVGDGDGSVVARDNGAIGPDGTFSFAWTGILEGGRSYHLDFYADHNGNGTCDSPPVDHAWRESLGTVTGPVTHHFDHNADFVNVCPTFS